METLLSIRKAAEKLGGLSEWTIRRWIYQGKLGSVKLGARRMISESEINRVIASSTEPARERTRNES
jgi:excisionase family DNA binding protein